jgi:hypothetical protein
MKKNALGRLFGLLIILGMVGCKNNNLFGDLHKEGSGDAASLVADGQAALGSSNFEKADSYFSQALEKDPRNSEALYGQAAAQMGLSGLSLGQLISNLTQGNSTSGAPGLRGAIQQASSGVSSVMGSDHPNSLLFGIDADALDDALKVVIVNLEKIRMGLSDGRIPSDSPSLLINLGLSRLLKAATKPLRLNYVDLRENNGRYTASLLVALSAEPCLVVDTSIHNVAWGFLNLRDAALNLNLVSGSTLADIQSDVDELYAEYKDVVIGGCPNVHETRGDAGVPTVPTDGTD